MRGPSPSTSKPRPSSRPNVWAVAGRAVSLADPVVIGILNVTPDSFSDGGELPSVDSALRRADQMLQEGAEILDVGGESTRPGGLPVAVDDELARVLPVVKALVKRFDVPVSIDTRKARVAEAALAAGAAVVNDVSALALDPALARAVAEAGAGVVLMHMRGTPENMMDHTDYDDLPADVAHELSAAVDRAQTSGIEPEAIVLDPGIGFAKTSRQSISLLGEVPRLRALGFPVLVGPSRKSFLGDLLGVPPKQRAVGTAAACLIAYQGGAKLFRVHDVAPTVQALTVARAVDAERPDGSTR